MALSLLVSEKVYAQQPAITADSAFIEMPASVLELLNKSTRMDMLDYYRADSIYHAKNLFDGESYLELVTPTYLKVNISSVSRMEIKILSGTKGKNVVAVSYTVDANGNQPDSKLFFFDSQMSPLEQSKILKTPELKHFFKLDKGSLTSMKELESMVPFQTVEYTFSPNDDMLHGRLTVEESVDVDDYNIMKLFLLPELTWRWDGKKFKQQK